MAKNKSKSEDWADPLLDVPVTVPEPAAEPEPELEPEPAVYEEPAAVWAPPGYFVGIESEGTVTYHEVPATHVHERRLKINGQSVEHVREDAGGCWIYRRM